jgi:hypothetical protein
MMIFYLDDTGEGKHVGLVAFGIPATSWKNAYEALSRRRRELSELYHIPFSSELHASEFLGGRGSAGRAVRSFADRLEIFNGMLGLANSINGATLICAFDKDDMQDRLYERLMNRVNRCATDRQSHAIIISDEGKDKRFRALARKLGKHNPIPSQFGKWPTGEAIRNVPNDNILEDIIFRKSDECRFIQLVDFCAYSLLRYEIPHQTRSELTESFKLLEAVRNKQAFSKDPRGMGIVRGR